MKFQIGYYSETHEGKKFNALSKHTFKTDAEAEAEVDGLLHFTPLDDDGCVRSGLYIKRGSAIWFRRFSHHLIAKHPKRPVWG